MRPTSAAAVCTTTAPAALLVAVAFLITTTLHIQVSTAFTPGTLHPIRPALTRVTSSSSWTTSTLGSSSTTDSSTTSSTTTSSSPLLAPVVLPETAPLAPHTFAGMVEAALLDKFGGTEIDRVLQSWRLLDADYVHQQFVGKTSKTDETSSNCHQLCHSYVPGLTVQEFWNIQEQPWANKLAKSYKAIQKEFRTVTANMEQLVQEGNNIWAGALTDDANSYGTGWKTLVLQDRGVWDPVNVNLFPATARAVQACGVPAVEVFFASMQPNTDIQMHSDFTNFVLTSHLAVDIPYSGENKCRLTIGDETREWINGQITMFDTSIMHDAVNESDKTRYILMIRLWHPELTEVEREALQFIYDCLANPGLTSADAGERFLAEQLVQAQHTFPDIKKGVSSVQGFGGGGGSAKRPKKKRK